MSLAVNLAKAVTSQADPSVAPPAAVISSGGGATVGAGLSYSPVPLKHEDLTARQQHHMAIEMLKSEEMNSNKSDDLSGGYTSRISEDEIRKSLLVEAKRRRYWNSKKIEKMVFEEISQICCFHYVLESFTETRGISEAVESSNSAISSSVGRSRPNEAIMMGSLSTANNRAQTEPPRVPDMKTLFTTDVGLNPWDFDVQPDDDFINQIKLLEMPNSHRFSHCHNCKGDSLVHCFHCRGTGSDKCTYCRGTGMKAGVAHPAVYTHPMIGTFPGEHAPAGTTGRSSLAGTAVIRPAILGAQRDKPYAAGTPVHFMAKAGLPPPGIGQHDLCIFCHGRGIRDCQHCKGQGKKSCPTCGGTGHIRVFTKLNVAFGVECSDYYTPCEIPDILLQQANGELIFSDCRPYVQPIRKNIVEINEISRRFCAAHLRKLQDSCRVLKQRHCIELIEVAKVRFRLGSKSGLFYVYGKQRLCYIPEGPSRCSIM